MKVIDAGHRLVSARWGRCGLARLLHLSAARHSLRMNRQPGAHGLLLPKRIIEAVDQPCGTPDLRSIVRRCLLASIMGDSNSYSLGYSESGRVLGRSHGLMCPGCALTSSLLEHPPASKITVKVGLTFFCARGRRPGRRATYQPVVFQGRWCWQIVHMMTLPPALTWVVCCMQTGQ
jgi:hypothetical protein